MAVLPEREIRSQPTEIVPVAEVGKIPETSAEKEGLIRRLEGPVLEKPVTGPMGQVLVAPPASQQPKIVLPISQTTYLDPRNWHKPVTQAVRWLIVFVRRLIMKYPDRTVFGQ